MQTIAPQSEPAGFCRGFGLPYIKSVPMADSPDLDDYARRYADAAALLLDSNASGEAGGTGRHFDWYGGIGVSAVPIVLAGGLNPQNVGAAIAAVRPYAVDVSSGVESARGRKDLGLMADFVAQVYRADRIRMDRQALD